MGKMPSLKLVQVILLSSKWCPHLAPAHKCQFQKQNSLPLFHFLTDKLFTSNVKMDFMALRALWYVPLDISYTLPSDIQGLFSHLCESEGETNSAFVDFNPLLTVSQFTVLLKEFWHATTDPFSLLAFKISCNSIMPNAVKYVEWGTDMTILPQDDVV